MRLLKPSDSIGLELDTGVIRVAALKGDKQALSMVALWEITIPEDAVSEGVVADVDAVARVLEEFWTKTRIDSREVVVGISNQGVLMRLANFPKIPDNKLVQALRFQAGEYFPILLDEMVFDYAIMGEVEGESGPQLQVLLVAARRDLLDKSLQAIQMASIMPRVVDASPLALLRTLPAERLGGSVLLVDISNGLTTLLLVAAGVPLFARVIPYSLKSYSCELGMPLEELLETVHQAAPAAQEDRVEEHTACGDTHGDVDAGSPPAGREFVEQTGGWESAMANEIRSSIGYYMAQSGAAVVDTVILSGRGARVAGLPEFIQKEIDVPVEIINPLVHFKNLNRVRGVDLQRKGPDFAVSIGLALRGLEE